MQLPGRTINPNSKITVTRLLPAPGVVLVQPGKKVEALRIIAQAKRPSRYRVIHVARQLARSKIDMDQVMCKAEGDFVEADEVIAISKRGLPFLRRTARAPVAGHIAAIGLGWVLLATEQTTIELQAFVNGVVSKIIPNRGVIIESRGAMITATCGFGGEAYGPLKRLVDRPSESLQVERIDERVKNAILLAGRSVDETVLRAAEEAQVRGIIVGSIDASLMNLDPPVRVRVVATEGFGYMPMASYTFGVLGTLDGKEVSIRGSTPAMASSASKRIQPEPPIILAATSTDSSQTTILSPPSQSGGRDVGVGSRVRVTRGRLLGASGTIDSFPSKPQATEAGIVAPGAYVKLNDTLYYIPWANLEQVN